MTDLLGDQCSEATSEILTKIATKKKKKKNFLKTKKNQELNICIIYVYIYIYIYIYIYKNYIIKLPSDISIIFQLFQA